MRWAYEELLEVLITVSLLMLQPKGLLQQIQGVDSFETEYVNDFLASLLLNLAWSGELWNVWLSIGDIDMVGCKAIRR